MCSARTEVLMLALAGALPDGSIEVALRHAERRGLRLTWNDADDVTVVRRRLEQEVGTAGAVILASGAAASSEELAAAVTRAPVPVLHVDAEPLTTRHTVHAACDRVLHGRGRRGLRAALDVVVAGAYPPHRHAYGPHPDQVLEVRWPADPPRGGVGTAVLFHGGFWLDPWERDQLDRLAIALTLRGWVTVNVGYRRTGPSGGGWPATLADACAALDAVADLPLRGDGPVVAIGHSAGAQLALYATTRAAAAERGAVGDRPSAGDDAPVARADAPGAATDVSGEVSGEPRGEVPGVVPRARPTGVAALAGLFDLAAAADAGLGDGAAVGFLGGGPDEVPERYAVASPVHRLPVGVPILALHGPDDRLVPVTQTRAFVAVARAAGDTVEHAEPATSHLAIIDPDGPAMPALATWLDGLLSA